MSHWSPLSTCPSNASNVSQPLCFMGDKLIFGSYFCITFWLVGGTLKEWMIQFIAG